MNNDKKIWEDFKKGDSYALSHIYYQHIDFLFRYGCKFSANKELVKDDIQELFFDLIRTRKNLGETDNIRFYLIKSFRRRLFRSLSKAENMTTTDNGHDFPANIVYSAEEILISKEETSDRDNMVRNALKELTPKQREILFYRFNCNFEYDQICEIMSLKYDSARKQVFRALQSLKEKLRDNGNILFFLYCINDDKPNGKKPG